MVAAYGVDPVLFMLAAQVFGSKESEFDVAGGIMGRGIELTDGECVSLPIPANAELVIEGLLHPGDTAERRSARRIHRLLRPRASPQPVIEVKALHCAQSPILTAALMAKYPSCEIGAYYAIMRSARILDDLERIGVPGVVGAYAHPAAASGWGMVVVSVQQQYAGHAAQVLALTAQCPAAAYYTKWIIAVDDDVDPTDFNEVLWALSTRCHPVEDIDMLRNTWSTGLDPSQFEMEARPYGSKALINACKPHRHLKQFPQSTLLRREVLRARRRALGGTWLRRAAALADLHVTTFAAPAERSVQPELAVDRPQLGRLDQLAVRHLHRMQRAVELLHPEGEEALQLGKFREQVVVLPDVGLQQPRMVRPTVEDLRGRQPITAQSAAGSLSRPFPNPPSGGFDF